MDAKEAISLLKIVDRTIDACPSQFENDDDYTSNDVGNAMMKAIEALDKQVPKEPIFDSGNRLCGECREIIKAYESHCPFCGQAIKNDKE